MSKLKNVTSPDTLIVITFAKAGLGHLRVAYALMEGLPRGARVSLFSSLDSTTTFMHRLSSNNPVFRELAEAMQYGVAERIFTSIYTHVLRLRAKALQPQVEAMLTGLKPSPKRVVFVATHFGLAHQISAIKPDLEAMGFEVKLVVVVTDDSPQRAWSVPGADLTIVPSKLTKLRLGAAHTEVAHYPLNLKLGHELKESRFKYKFKQAQAQSKVKIKVSLPVSGAAVGLGFYSELTHSLNEPESRFRFYVTSRDSAYTKQFLAEMGKLAYTEVYSHSYDRLVVVGYEKVMQKNTIAFEVTKPSEQAFKALYTPRQTGGVILLFSRPVGRQEYDNLWFLARNNLIPSKEEQKRLWAGDKSVIAKAKKWRGIRLPTSPRKSALFIDWCLKAGVFENMMGFTEKPKSSGVNDIWRLVDLV